MITCLALFVLSCYFEMYIKIYTSCTYVMGPTITSEGSYASLQKNRLCIITWCCPNFLNHRAPVYGNMYLSFISAMGKNIVFYGAIYRANKVETRKVCYHSAWYILSVKEVLIPFLRLIIY
jgi:hypothetical protein